MRLILGRDDFSFEQQDFDAASIMQTPPEPPAYTIPGMAIEPGPVTLLSALTNRGKSLLLTHVGLCVATGMPILGQLATKKSKVLWIDGELGLRKYRDNYCRKVISGAPELLPEPGQFRARSYFGDSDIPDFTRQDDLDHVARLLDGRQLCIIDCLRRFYSGDENASESADILIKLGGISARTGCAIVIIHHHRKPGRNGGGDGEFAMRGSIAFADVADGVYRISRNKNEVLTLHQDKSRASQRMKPISYRMENAGRYLGDGMGYEGVRFVPVAQQVVVQEKDVAEVIVGLLRSSPTPVAKTELIEKAGRKAETTRQAIDELVKGRKIVEEKQGRTKLYSLPQATGEVPTAA